MAQTLELETGDNNQRTMALLKFRSDNTTSSNLIRLEAGLTSTSETQLSNWASTYTAVPGYAGYGGINNPQSGLLLRANGPSGSIKFLTGGTSITNDTAMRIESSGNVNIGLGNPFSKLQVEAGDIFVKDLNRGVIMKSPNGNCWKLQVSNAGSPSFSSVSCPDAQN